MCQNDRVYQYDQELTVDVLLEILIYDLTV